MTGVSCARSPALASRMSSLRCTKRWTPRSYCLTPGTGSFRFRHALSRDAVLAGLFPAELKVLSRRALDAVESVHPSLVEGWGELAAELAAGAGERGRAARLRLEGARRALGRGALATAEATLERARGLLPSADPTSVDVDE